MFGREVQPWSNRLLAMWERGGKRSVYANMVPTPVKSEGTVQASQAGTPNKVIRVRSATSGA